MTRQTYRRIADDLRERITSGVLTPGAVLPTHDELMREFSAPRATVRRALEELTRQGFLIARQPQGVFVRDTNRLFLDVGEGFAPPFPNLGDRLMTALAADRKISRTVTVNHATPPSGVAKRLAVEDRPVLLRHEVVQAGGHRIGIVNTSIPTHIATGSPLEHPEPGIDVPATLADLGHAVVEVTEELFVRLALAEESREMWWPAGAAVLAQMRTGYAGGGEPVMCSVQILPGDTWIISERRPIEVPPQMQAAG